MKKLLKGFMFGSVLAALTVVSAVPTFAQQSCDDDADTKAAVYAKFTNNYKSDDVAKIQTAITGAKEYIQKYASCDGEDQTIPNYLKKAYPKLEEKVGAIKKIDADKAVYGRFNKAVEGDTVNASEAFSGGKDILAKTPDSLDLKLVLASIGFDEAAKETPNNTFNNQTIDYAQEAIKQLESGAKSVTGNYGAYRWIYKNNDFSDGKSNALGWMNYTIGYIKFFRQNKKEEALPYFYEATKYNSGTKKDPFIYQTLGKVYLDKTKELANQYAEIVKANNGEENDEAKRLFGLQKAYADRAVDAYARAYSYAKTGTDKTYTDGLYKTLEGLYTFRNDGKADGLEGYVAGINNRPMPDPASEIKPAMLTTDEDGADGATTGTNDSSMKKPDSTMTKKPDSTMKKTDSTMTNKNNSMTKTDSTTVTVKKDEAKTTPANGKKTPANGTTKPKKP